MRDRIEYRDPSTLTNHPANIAIYGDVPDQDFVAKVREHGVTTPLKILPDGTILGGHRRRQAAIIVGLQDVPVIVMELDEAESLLELAMDNEYRQETTEQRVRRAKLIEESERMRAEKRQEQTRAKTGSKVGMNSSPPTKHEKNANSKEKGKSATKAAEAVGMGRQKYERAKAVVAKADAIAATDKVAAERIKDALEKSPAAAEREIQRFEAAAKPIVEGCIVRDDTDRDVPLRFRDAYALAPQLAELIKSIGKLKGEISRIQPAAGAVWLDCEYLKRTLGVMASMVKDAVYWTHCPRCDADGCGWCLTHGWLPKAYSRNLCDEDKAKIGVAK